MASRLLLTDANPKTQKGTARGWLTFVMHLAPVRSAGRGNVCGSESKGCSRACLYRAGRAGIPGSLINPRRIARTRWYFDQPGEFLTQLVHEVELAAGRARRLGYTPAFRLNATSDVRWERVPVVRAGVVYPSIMAAFPDLQWYDYTKHTDRPAASLPPNYHLTFSRSEENESEVDGQHWAGRNVAVVFDPAYRWGSWRGIPIVNGDRDDLRFLDPPGVVVGLTPKGRFGKTDRSGFVVR